MTAHDPATLAAADHYAARARALANLPDTERRPALLWHIRAVALVERARRAELLDPEERSVPA